LGLSANLRLYRKEKLMFLREPQHWIPIVLIFALLFGAKRLPDSARQLGRSMRIFKSEMKELKNDDAEDLKKNDDSSEK
jgi:sec-independent protein translocase protein TatA